MRAKCIVMLCALFIGGDVRAQTVGGRWTGNIDAGVRLAGDSAIVVKREALVLDLTLRGDSVTGTVDRGGRWRAGVRGTFDGTRLELQAAALERNFYVNGVLVMDTIRYTWSGTLAQGELRGGLSTDPTHAKMPPLRWEARKP
jgi:hypothetical protein